MGLQFSSVQLLSYVQLFATSWTAACQASLSITNSQSLLKVISIASVMPSNRLILCLPLLLLLSIFPSIRVFPMSQFFVSGGQSIRASASVLPMNFQDWFPLGLTGWISLQSKGFSRVFPINSSVLSFLYGQVLHPYMTTGKNIALTIQTFVGKIMSLLFNMLSRFVIAFLHMSFNFMAAGANVF